MIHRKNKKLPCLILLLYLMLSIEGSMVFSANEAFGFADSDTGKQAAAGFFLSIAHTVDWLAEDSATIGKAKGHSTSVLRNVLLRVFISLSVYFAVVCFARLYVLQIKNDNTQIYKNNILFKLRI